MTAVPETLAELDALIEQSITGRATEIEDAVASVPATCADQLRANLELFKSTQSAGLLHIRARAARATQSL